MERFGPFFVYEQLGVGGMAQVHRAERALPCGDKQTIALKRLLPELSRDRSYVRRFVDEARLGQRLKHANITKTFEVGCLDGTHFMAHELVRGPTVLELLQRDEAVPLAIVLRIITSVARALAYAHGVRDERGQSLKLVHRDIAPSNILVSETGATKLIDFGVAKTSTTHVRTQNGCVVGKLGYIAPEYLAGRFDARVDLYSLGIVAYELLTHQPLFNAKDLRTAEMLRALPIEKPSTLNHTIPDALDDIVMHCLERDPSARWASAFDLYTALSTFVHDNGFDIGDHEVAQWISQKPARRPPSILRDLVELDIDVAFERVVA